jgi:hypothetical protein
MIQEGHERAEEGEDELATTPSPRRHPYGAEVPRTGWYMCFKPIAVSAAYALCWKRGAPLTSVEVTAVARRSIARAVAIGRLPRAARLLPIGTYKVPSDCHGCVLDHRVMIGCDDEDLADRVREVVDRGINEINGRWRVEDCEGNTWEVVAIDVAIWPESEGYESPECNESWATCTDKSCETKNPRSQTSATPRFEH